MTIEYGLLEGGSVYRLVRKNGVVVSLVEYAAWESYKVPEDVLSLLGINGGL